MLIPDTTSDVIHDAENPAGDGAHLWADCSRAKCPWAQAYYRHKRERGMGHAAALRCLAMRWLKILWRMWADHAAYHGERHQRDQVRHGSWVIALVPEPALQPH